MADKKPIKRTVAPPPGPPDWEEGPQVSPDTLRWLQSLQAQGKLPPVPGQDQAASADTDQGGQATGQPGKKK